MAVAKEVTQASHHLALVRGQDKKNEELPKTTPKATSDQVKHAAEALLTLIGNDNEMPAHISKDSPSYYWTQAVGDALEFFTDGWRDHRSKILIKDPSLKKQLHRMRLARIDYYADKKIPSETKGLITSISRSMLPENSPAILNIAERDRRRAAELLQALFKAMSQVWMKICGK